MKKPVVVGISGGTCSGKSTLLERIEPMLAKDYKVCSIRMDKYYKRPGITTIAPITRIEYVEHNHPDALNLDQMFIDFDAAVADETNDIVLIEGLFALYLDHIRDQLDVKVFIDLAADERCYRRIKRWLDRQPMEEIASRYLDTVRFRHNELVEPTRWHADLVINGNFDYNNGIDVLYSYIVSKASK